MLLTLLGISLIGQYIKQIYYLYLDEDATCVLVKTILTPSFKCFLKGQLDGWNHTDAFLNSTFGEESQVLKINCFLFLNTKRYISRLLILFNLAKYTLQDVEPDVKDELKRLTTSRVVQRKSRWQDPKFATGKSLFKHFLIEVFVQTNGSSL